MQAVIKITVLYFLTTVLNLLGIMLDTLYGIYSTDFCFDPRPPTYKPASSC